MKGNALECVTMGFYILPGHNLCSINGIITNDKRCVMDKDACEFLRAKGEHRAQFSFDDYFDQGLPCLSFKNQQKIISNKNQWIEAFLKELKKFKNRKISDETLHWASYHVGSQLKQAEKHNKNINCYVICLFFFHFLTLSSLSIFFSFFIFLFFMVSMCVFVCAKSQFFNKKKQKN